MAGVEGAGAPWPMMVSGMVSPNGIQVGWLGASRRVGIGKSWPDYAFLALARSVETS
jgi:hypothetical protein